MKIEDFIRTKFINHLKDNRVLVVYDSKFIYKEIIHSIKSSNIIIIDGTKSTISARLASMKALRELKDEELLVIYLPIPNPDEDKKLDNPYSVFSSIGSYFPDSTNHSYEILCKQAMPEYSLELDQLFKSNKVPSFQQINSLKTGIRYPILQSILNAHGAIDIIINFIFPDDKLNVLQDNSTWKKEFANFLVNTLGLTIDIEKSYSELVNIVINYILFSEFVLDLPGKLPDSLKYIPHSDIEHKELIYSICDRMRNDITKQDKYIEFSESISKRLNLEQQFKDNKDLGKRDTFSFEEKRFLNIFEGYLNEKDYEKAREIYNDRLKSIWVNNFPDRNCLWNIARRSLDITLYINDINNNHLNYLVKIKDFLNFYAEIYYRIDSEYRLLEKDFSDNTLTSTYQIESMVNTIRILYKNMNNIIQKKYLERVQVDEWPVTGVLRHTQIFNHYVKPELDDNKRVVFFMIDALRYELAYHIYNDIQDMKSKRIEYATAQLPTSTTIGMAALLPDADGKLFLKVDEDGYKVLINDRKMDTKSERETYLRELYGDRIQFWDLNELKNSTNTSLKKKINKDIDLLIVHSKEIDSLGENSPDLARTAITDYNQNIIRAIYKLSELNFQTVIISSDHGFVLNHDTDLGDTISTPAGSWGYKKRRCIIGSGQNKDGVISFKPKNLGLNTNARDFVVPNSYATFQSGSSFYHEGISLQENIIPIIRIELRKQERSKDQKLKYQLSYKLGKTPKVTTRTPFFDLVIESNVLFMDNISIAISAFSNSIKIGDVTPAPNVDSNTKLVNCIPNENNKIGLILQDDFSGPFEVRVYDPNTDVTYASINLTLDIME